MSRIIFSIEYIFKKINMEELNQLLKERKLNQRKLAIALGVSPSVVNAWVHDIKKPSFENIRLLAEYFDVPISYFYKMVEVNDILEIEKGGQVAKEDPRKEISTLNEGLKMGKESHYIYYTKEEDSTVNFVTGTKIIINVKAELQNEDMVIAKVKGKEGHIIGRVMIGKDKIIMMNEDFDVYMKDDILCMYLVESYETKTRK